MARIVGERVRTVQRLLLELENGQVFSKNEAGTIFSRRMVRDEEIRRKRAEGGIKSLEHPNVPQPKGCVEGSHKGYPSYNPSIHPCVQSFGGSPSSSSSFSKEEKIAVPPSSEPANGTQHNGHKSRRSYLADDEFIAALKQNSAYRGIDIDHEIGKLRAWLLTPKGRGKQLTQNRLVNWLNKIDKPMQMRKERLPL